MPETEQWRVSLPKRKEHVPVIDESVAGSLDSAEIISSKLFSLKGVSLQFLNGFWRQVLTGQRYPDLKIYSTLSDLYEDADNRATNLSEGMSSLGESRPEQVLARLQIGRKVALPRNSSVRMLNEVRGEKNRMRVMDSQGKKFTVLKEQLNFKERSDWTLTDVQDFCLMQDVQMVNGPFMERLNNTRYVGDDFKAIYVSYPPDCQFGTLLRSIRLHTNNEGEDVAFAKFIWIDIFCTNLNSLKENENHRNRSPHQMQAFTHRYLQAKRQLMLKCTSRYIFFDHWMAPTILNHAHCVYDLFHIFKSGSSYVLLPEPGMTGEFATVYSLSDEDGGHYTRDTLFEIIKTLDPTRMECRDNALHQTIIRELTDDAKNPKGFRSVIDVITENIADRYSRDVENDVKSSLRGRNFKTGNSYADLLVKTGTFMFDRGHISVAKSYIEEAIKIYNMLEDLLEKRYFQDLQKQAGVMTIHAMRSQQGSAAERSLRSLVGNAFTLNRNQSYVADLGAVDPVTGAIKRTLEEQYNLDVVQVGLSQSKVVMARILFANADIDYYQSVQNIVSWEKQQPRSLTLVMKYFTEAENHVRNIWSQKQRYYVNIFLARAKIYVKLADGYADMRQDLAKSYRRKALDDFDAVALTLHATSSQVDVDPNEGEVARLKYLQAEQLIKLKDFGGAQSLLEEAEEFQQNLLDKNSLTKFKHVFVEYCDTLYLLSRLLFEKRRFKAAKEYLLTLEQVELLVYGNCNKYIASLYLLLGHTCGNLKEFETSLKYFFNAVNIYQSAKGKRNREIAAAYEAIGTAFRQQQEYSKAEQSLHNALGILDMFDEDDLVIQKSKANTQFALGKLFEAMGVEEKALRSYKKCQNIRENVLSPEDALVIKVKKKITALLSKESV